MALEEWGTIRKACQVAGVARPTYYVWNSNDPEFAEAADAARKSFAESLEELALDRVKNPEKGKGSDILLLGLLNANMPHKFRPQVSMNEDSAKELIVEWRKAAKEIKKDRPDEEGTTLGEDVEKTLQEILTKKNSDSKKLNEEKA
jgi:bifunctional DNA-binding transcriptional regulator/antitoxin component of YhaV-PrlF toxin-antitoxin module